MLRGKMFADSYLVYLMKLSQRFKLMKATAFFIHFIKHKLLFNADQSA
jgi:hypothetical protein